MGSNPFIGSQVLTFAIPLGTLGLLILWGFFQRQPRRPER
jgi:hypothetical protein